MRGIMGRLSVVAVAGLVILTAVARADDKAKPKKVPLDKVPKAVMAAIKDRFPGADIASVEAAAIGNPRLDMVPRFVLQAFPYCLGETTRRRGCRIPHGRG